MSKHRIKTTKEFPVKNKYYYIIDYRKFLKPVLLPTYFVDAHVAKRAVIKTFSHLKVHSKYFKVMKGSKLRKMELNYVVGHGNHVYKGSKYDYPSKDMTDQERKSHRTLHRRRLKRIGLQTTMDRVKLRYNEPNRYIKHKPTTQAVAQNPTTKAQVIQLSRKRKTWYYFIISKSLSGRKGRLFKLDCIRIDIKDLSMKRCRINTLRTDIIKVVLTDELQTLIINHEKGNEETFHNLLRRVKRLRQKEQNQNL